jgi:hypothetical protein
VLTVSSEQLAGSTDRTHWRIRFGSGYASVERRTSQLIRNLNIWKHRHCESRRDPCRYSIKQQVIFLITHHSKLYREQVPSVLNTKFFCEVARRSNHFFPSIPTPSWNVSVISEHISPLVQSWTGPYGSKSLRLPDFLKNDTWNSQGCQFYATAAFTTWRHHWYSFLLQAEPGRQP